MMRIGETAAAAGLTAKTLRFYEDRGLLPAAERAPNGYRDYPLETVSRLEFIRRGRTAGLTLAQIGDILSVRDLGQAPCVHVKDLLANQLRDLDAQIAELTALRATVAEFHDAAAAGDPAACDPERICSYL
ncbi:MAG: hypoxia response transcriptional regulator [Pseudarthrobacter sp.]